VGVEHDTWGEEVGVVIKPQESATADADAIKAFCRAELAGYKVPEHVVFTDEPLERNALQKLLKAAIKERYFG
jgi:fatty-acyl-CoA synthase